MRAIGNPVALDASAELRDTRGFISITSMSPSVGFTANWMLHPPASTPISRMIAIAASRIRWYSRSVRVMAGATVIDSPVCTPMGPRFSMEHTITTMSRRALNTSILNFILMCTPRSSRAVPMAACPLHPLTDPIVGHGLDVGPVGELRVGHDRGGVGIHQDHRVALLLQGLDRLRARVVELRGLADHDRAGAEEQDALEVSPLGHRARLAASGRASGAAPSPSPRGAWRRPRRDTAGRPRA